MIAEDLPITARIKAILDGVNAWFHETLGLDFYDLAKTVIGFALVAARLLLELADKAVTWLQVFVSGQ